MKSTKILSALESRSLSLEGGLIVGLASSLACLSFATLGFGFDMAEIVRSAQARMESDRSSTVAIANVDNYQPPDVGGPQTSKGSGTR
jgi:hypothetical protein